MAEKHNTSFKFEAVDVRTDKSVILEQALTSQDKLDEYRRFIIYKTMFDYANRNGYDKLSLLSVEDKTVSEDTKVVPEVQVLS